MAGLAPAMGVQRLPAVYLAMTRIISRTLQE